MNLRRLLVLFGLIALMPGCGMAVRKLDADAFQAAATVHRSFPEPSHRVALATFEALRQELASADFAGDSEFSAAGDPSKEQRPQAGAIPVNLPMFWLEWKGKGHEVRELVTLRACHFSGKTRDGRAVKVAVLIQPDGTLVSVLVDDLGDRVVSRVLLDRVADRLSHPSSPAGSIEEAATLQSFFGGSESREALPSIRKPAVTPLKAE